MTKAPFAATKRASGITTSARFFPFPSRRNDGSAPLVPERPRRLEWRDRRALRREGVAMLDELVQAKPVRQILLLRQQIPHAPHEGMLHLWRGGHASR